MKIGVFVGSFDPVHKGHKYIIDALLEKKQVDKIIVIPTQEYWDKKCLVDLKHRINMLKFYGTEDILINEDLNNVKYTYQILNRLKQKYVGDELYLIIGADNLVNFHLWENVDEILNNYVIVLDRGDINLNTYINKFDKKNKFLFVQGFEKINISSSMIRDNVIDNKNHLDDKVFEYIIKNNLYLK